MPGQVKSLTSLKTAIFARAVIAFNTGRLVVDVVWASVVGHLPVRVAAVPLASPGWRGETLVVLGFKLERMWVPEMLGKMLVHLSRLVEMSSGALRTAQEVTVVDGHRDYCDSLPLGFVPEASFHC